ncbi:putative flavin-containing monooxygenase 1 [Senna tora]|uniref:Flavin-containing monooxygenase n=1 Tax=Senna tora TaxID=362788 RepID=A0A834XF92_9FABA|nr:putative flavin-containing monooxygenase 1 [Senna tora]
MDHSHSHRERQEVVGIIGGGISGLLACKYLKSKGFDPIVFEAHTTIGGVWSKVSSTTFLQSPKPIYSFSDYPWPSSSSECPSQLQVMEYVMGYAHHFNLLKHIKFNSLVQGIEYDGPEDEGEMKSWDLWGGNGEPFRANAKWKVLVKNTINDSSEVYRVDFVILCIGRFSDVANIPEFEEKKGPEVFKGKVMHSMEFTSMDDQTAAEFVKGKNVTVVGFQKYAVDIAMQCSQVNGEKYPCKMLYKTEHWCMPDLAPWGIPLPFLYFTRFSELLVHKPGQSFFHTLIATTLSPLRWALSKFVESYVKRKQRLAKFGMVPKQSFLRDLSASKIFITPEKFYDRVEEGSIILKKSPSFWFDEEGVVVEGESTPLKADLVIFATGFKSDHKLRDIFVSPTFQNLIMGSPDAAVPLYRECINPEIPQVAVIGFSESLSNLYTSEMRCRWVAEFLSGKFKLPSIKEMKKDMEKWDKYMKEYSGNYYRRSSIAALHIWYNDQLCKDMGWSPRRKKGLLAELFEPYGPMDYSSN